MELEVVSETTAQTAQTTSTESTASTVATTLEYAEENWQDTVLYPQFSPHIYYFSPSQSAFTSFPSRQCTFSSVFVMV